MRNLYLVKTGVYGADLTVSERQLKFTTTDLEYISQKITNNLSVYKNEFFLDEDLGVPYFQEVFVKDTDLNTIKSIFLSKIMEIEYVQKVLDLQLSYNSELRHLTITTKILLNNNTILNLEV